MIILLNCIAEIKYNNGEWVNIGWVVMPYNGGHGVRATQYGNKIHLYVGDIYIFTVIATELMRNIYILLVVYMDKHQQNVE